MSGDCRHEHPDLLVASDDVAHEIELRRRFFLTRLEGDLTSPRDIIEMTIDADAPIDLCSCGVLVRADPMRTPARFAADEYHPRTLEMLHQLHVATFVAKTWIRNLLPPDSRVLEIGSYVGGFLEAARRWHWRATGVDIGRSTSEFARSKGFDVTTERFERCEFEPQSFDGIFIWSCFEQMIDADDVLDRCSQIIKRDAPLVITTPDAAAYIDAQRAFARGEPRNESSPCVQRLAYNNLLGFPHRFGYTEMALQRIARRAGFTVQSVTRVPAIRPYRDHMTASARDEESRVAPAWIEAVYRRER